MAQLVAHHTGSVGVRGSNPLSSTRKNPKSDDFGFFAGLSGRGAIDESCASGRSGLSLRPRPTLRLRDTVRLSRGVPCGK